MSVFHRLFVCASAAILMAMAFGTTVRADYASTVQLLNPICYYQFNDGAGAKATGNTCADTISAANNGTYVSGGTAQTVTLGPGLAGLGTAAYFTNGNAGGSNLGLATLPTSELPGGNSERTMVYWVQALSNGGGWHVDFRYGSFNGSYDVGSYCMPDGHFGVGTLGYSISTGYMASGSEANSNWHMVAVTITPHVTVEKPNGADWNVYIDGVSGGLSAEMPLNTRTDTVPTTEHPDVRFTIGGWEGDNGWGGGIDEFAVFGRALTPTEITGLYNAATVPEPSTLALLAGGLFGLMAYAWRKRK